ncbi:MAG: hypothetical protein JST22_05935, partial [Bacteroidetes bacterium]|nr:hypothetical protein [Bacteroidota bacterium]
MDAMEIAACGGACKASRQGAIAGHLVVFGSPGAYDLTRHRDFFTPRTAFELDACGFKSRTLHDHGLDPVLKGRRLAIGALRVDDIGIWIEAQLALRDEYEAALYHLAATNKLNWSSGTAGHLVERKAIRLDEGTVVHEVITWPLGLDASTTTRPADPRGLVSVKSLVAQPDLGAWLELPSVKAAVDSIRRSAGAPVAAYSFSPGFGSGLPAMSARADEMSQRDVPVADAAGRPEQTPASPGRAYGERSRMNRPRLPGREGNVPFADVKGTPSGVLPVRSFIWLQRVLARSGVPVLADFSSPLDLRGGTPEQRSALLEDIAANYNGSLLVVAVDMERSAEVGAAYGIYDAATLLFNNGGVTERTDGPFALGMMLARLDAAPGLGGSNADEPQAEGVDGAQAVLPADGIAGKALAECRSAVLPRNYPAVTWHQWALEPQWVGNQADTEAMAECPDACEPGVNPARNPLEPADLLPADWELLMRHGAIVKPAGADGEAGEAMPDPMVEEGTDLALLW